MRISEIKATENIKEMWELFVLHREELATYKHIMKVNPDVAMYKILEDTGKIFTLALYDENKIVGYSVTLVFTHMHYSDTIHAQNDLIFVHPDYRRGRHGIKLIAETERIAKERGAKFIIFHGKEGTKFCELMPKMGYTVHDIVFTKEI